ncbi:hypothetical protein [Marinibacterium sp. SX1]|mgnify:CR=1 FL=1|uniref:hypothetical protein n=1 Tax=Marinibacterium sp. SX1 TaxID=3388424 RepID=UPI003D168384|tara:strand:- start:202 stop:393 length:192 start_codon:yes stop_codon:yes gene_type:complete
MKTLAAPYVMPHNPGFLRNLLSAFTAALAAQKAYGDLNRLSDAELSRMGMTREDIPARVQDML